MKIHLASALCSAFILSACGGGGDGSSADNSGPIDKYIGTWKGACDTRGDIYQSVDGRTTSVIDSVKFSKLTATTANVALTTTVYGNSDTACTGTPLGSIVMTGLSTNSESFGASGFTSSYGQNVWSYDANVTLAAGQKVDQVSYSESKLSANANANITAGQIKFNTAVFAARSDKVIAYFVNSNTIVLNSNTANEGYPTALDQNIYTTYTKQ
jgi:hypothetical protein